MKTRQSCQCDKPLPRERAERKGVSETLCARCKLPIGLRPAAFRRVA